MQKIDTQMRVRTRFSPYSKTRTEQQLRCQHQDDLVLPQNTRGINSSLRPRGTHKQRFSSTLTKQYHLFLNYILLLVFKAIFTNVWSQIDVNVRKDNIVSNYNMARHFWDVSPHGNSGFSQSFLKMAYEITKLCIRCDEITGNTRTVTVVFQFAEINDYSRTFQRHIKVKHFCEI